MSLTFTISEGTGLFILPFMITMGSKAWDLINATGLFLLPISILIVSAFFEARAKGRDEGTPSVIFIKTLEARLIPVLLTLYFATMPFVSNSSGSAINNYNFAAYSCTGIPSIVGGLTNVSSLAPNTNMANYYGNDNPSLMFGLINELGTGLNGAAIGSLNCTPGANRNEVAESLSNYRIYDNKLTKAIKEFDTQCYTVATQKLARLRGNGTELSIDFSESPYNSMDTFGYEGEAIKKVYSGYITTSPILPTMMFNTPDYWNDVDSSTSSNTEITCESAASKVTDLISSDLQEHIADYNVSTGASFSHYTPSYENLISNIMETVNTTEGRTMTKSEAIDELAHSAYRNSISSWYNPLIRDSTVEKTTSLEDRTAFKNAQEAQNNPDSEEQTEKKQLLDQQERSGGTMALSYFGSLWVNLTKSIEVMTYVRMAPLLVTISQGMVLAFAPIIIVLSGYNSKILLNLAIFYFSLCLTPFFLNLGIMLDTVITGIIDVYSDGLPTQNAAVVENVNMLSTILILFCPTAWMTLMQMLGNYLSSSIDLTGAGQGAAQQTTQAIANQGRRTINDVSKIAKKKYLKATGNEKGMDNRQSKGVNAMHQRAKEDMNQMIINYSKGR